MRYLVTVRISVGSPVPPPELTTAIPLLATIAFFVYAVADKFVARMRKPIIQAIDFVTIKNITIKNSYTFTV